MRKLYILAPNDRFNYGDLLFPYVLDHYFRDLVDEVVFCSSSEADLTAMGGHRTQPFYRLYEADPADENYLVVAGGESLIVSWCGIFSFIYPSFSRIVRFFQRLRVPYLLYGSLLEAFIRKRFRTRTKFPFAIGKNELPQFKRVIYNSLGGSAIRRSYHILYSAKAKAVYQSVDYLAVRDQVTHDGLLKLGVESQICADSAVLMSKVFTRNGIISRMDPQLLICVRDKYLFFQIGESYVRGHVEVIADALLRIHKQTGLRLVLCPIGTALGHSDHIALAQVAGHLPVSAYQLVEKPSVWDIMGLIAQAALYVGTSLHGTITAMSFGTDFLAYGPLKLKAYIERWVADAGSTPLFTTIPQLEEDVYRRLASPYHYDPTGQFQSIEGSFAHIRELME